MHQQIGIPLSTVPAVSEAARQKLSQLHITTAEELLALAAVEGAREGLARHLGIGSAKLAGLVEELRKALPARTVAEMEQPYTRQLGLGAMEPPTEMRMAAAGPFESAVPIAALPASVNYTSRMPPIKNQGARGTCVAFACTAMDEDYNTVVKGSTPDLSEQCLYKRCKEQDGYPNAEGTFIAVAMDILVNTGQSTETCEPYNPNLPTNQPGPHPACCASQSPTYRIHAKIQLNQNSPNDFKAALADNRVVPFSIPVFASWYNSAAVNQSGNITMPLPGEQPMHAGTSTIGHAMLIVGYQDDAATPGGGYFILRNSWGTVFWGHACTYGAGCGTIPYQYISDWAWEAWAYQRPPQILCPPRPNAICPPRPRAFCPPAPWICPPRPIFCPPRPYWDPWGGDPWSAAYYPQQGYGYPQTGNPYYDPQTEYYSGSECPPEYYPSGWHGSASGYWQGYDPGPASSPPAFQPGRFNPGMKEKK